MIYCVVVLLVGIFILQVISLHLHRTKPIYEVKYQPFLMQPECLIQDMTLPDGIVAVDEKHLARYSPENDVLKDHIA